MKKLYMIITLFVSSFFFISNEVKAVDIYEVNYNDTSLDVINDEFFKIRNIVREFAITNSYNYLIRRISSLTYDIYFFDSSISSLTSTGRTWFEFKNVSMLLYNIDENFNLYYVSTISSFTMPSDRLYEIVDTNLDIFYNPYTIQINYSNLSYIVDSVNTLPSLFDIYCDYFDYVEKNPHQEEIEKVGNFYTVVIDRLGYLAKEMSSNYIYLSIFAIFVFIFVIELIRRRCI